MTTKTLRLKADRKRRKQSLPVNVWGVGLAGGPACRRRAKLKMFLVVREFTRLKQSKLCHYILNFYL